MSEPSSSFSTPSMGQWRQHVSLSPRRLGQDRRHFAASRDASNDDNRYNNGGGVVHDDDLSGRNPFEAALAVEHDGGSILGEIQDFLDEEPQEAHLSSPPCNAWALVGDLTALAHNANPGTLKGWELGRYLSLIEETISSPTRSPAACSSPTGVFSFSPAVSPSRSRVGAAASPRSDGSNGTATSEHPKEQCRQKTEDYMQYAFNHNCIEGQQGESLRDALVILQRAISELHGLRRQKESFGTNFWKRQRSQDSEEDPFKSFAHSPAMMSARKQLMRAMGKAERIENRTKKVQAEREHALKECCHFIDHLVKMSLDLRTNGRGLSHDTWSQDADQMSATICEAQQVQNSLRESLIHKRVAVHVHKQRIREVRNEIDALERDHAQTKALCADLQDKMAGGGDVSRTTPAEDGGVGLGQAAEAPLPPAPELSAAGQDSKHNGQLNGRTPPRAINLAPHSLSFDAVSMRTASPPKRRNSTLGDGLRRFAGLGGRKSYVNTK